MDECLSFEKLKEHKQHGDIMLPVALYPVTSHSAGRILPYHWHNEMEFIYLISGRALFTVDDVTIMAQAGECIFVNSGQIHSGISDTDASSYFSVVFSTEFLSNSFDTCSQFFEGIKTGRVEIMRHFKPEFSSQRVIISTLSDIVKELTDRNTAYELIVKSRLLSIFGDIFRNGHYALRPGNFKQPLHTKKYDTLKKVLGCIYRNYNKKIKLSELSESVNLTPQYLCRFFREMTQTNITDYINRYRIETAANLLRSSSLNITDIAIECGFDNIGYFNRVFKNHTGCTPTEYRKRNLMNGFPPFHISSTCMF